MMKDRTVKLGRNDPCPCGSGLKYKKCCLRRAKPETDDLKALYAKKYRIRLKQAADIQAIREAGRLVIDTLDLVESKIKPGITTEEINTLVHEYTIKHGAIPAPLNYRGFPKSVCVSVNEVICHGIPGERVLKD
ncbi:MAG: M24 family metallopeptidase, partial [Desulfobacterales bacterium]